ncbi:hypothetical protein BDV95DRAFT_591200 [Massariosphaeria phaeospora]|uniref:Uncharacterized protein n=1 Tax=Massariosphaeria phaeospora TaxID=100035 RepID=A0A7C8MKP8_9PLEO|nr:hypothetical protein BDV95DRAFT_591200 [Massariosphaeria phaeospora]
MAFSCSTSSVAPPISTKFVPYVPRACKPNPKPTPKAKSMATAKTVEHRRSGVDSKDGGEWLHIDDDFTMPYEATTASHSTRSPRSGCDSEAERRKIARARRAGCGGEAEAKPAGALGAGGGRPRRPNSQAFSSSGRGTTTQPKGAQPATAAAELANGLVYAGGGAILRVVRVVRIVRIVAPPQAARQDMGIRSDLSITIMATLGPVVYYAPTGLPGDSIGIRYFRCLHGSARAALGRRPAHRHAALDVEAPQGGRPLRSCHCSDQIRGQIRGRCASTQSST